MKGISGDGELGRGRCGGLGRCERSGLGCSMKWTAAELLDTVARRGVDGGHGYGEGVAAMASAMAGEREGEELERRGGVWGVRGSEGGRSTTSPSEGSGEAASRCVAPMRCSPSSTCLPAWPEAARWRGAGLGRQVGRCWATGKPFPIFSVFCFY